LIASTVLQFGKAVELLFQKKFSIGAGRKIARQKPEREEAG
jgi:hypothetical protein